MAQLQHGVFQRPQLPEETSVQLTGSAQPAPPQPAPPAHRQIAVRKQQLLVQQSQSASTHAVACGVVPTQQLKPHRCPYCGRREDGERDADQERPEPGRYKARKRPRKENPLAFWNNKYGYTGDAYCKACSESFRSHLLRQGHQTRSGCSRQAPCVSCTRVLAGFDRTKETVFQQYDADRAVRMQKRQAPATVKVKAESASGTSASQAAATVRIKAESASGTSASTQNLGDVLAQNGDPTTDNSTRSGDASSASRKRRAVMAGTLALVSSLGLLMVTKQAAKGAVARDSTADDLGNTSALDNIPSATDLGPTTVYNSSDAHGDSHVDSLQDSPLWTDPFAAMPAQVHNKFAVSVVVSLVLACCGLRARRKMGGKMVDETEEASAAQSRPEVQFKCCGSRGGSVTWARWLVAFSVVGCVYSLCLTLVIVFTWDITWGAPQQHNTEAVFTTAETLTLFAVMPCFLVRFENLPYRKCFWYAWSFFAFIWVLSTVLRSLNVQSVAAPCVEEAATVNAADATLAGQGYSCDLVIAAGLADCESVLAPVGELAHSCDVACGFRECDDSQIDSRTSYEKTRGELLAVLGWIQLAHPMLHVGLCVVIWQAVVQVKEQEKEKETEKAEENDNVRKITKPIVQQSLSLGLLDKAVTPWYAPTTSLCDATLIRCVVTGIFTSAKSCWSRTAGCRCA